MKNSIRILICILVSIGLLSCGRAEKIPVRPLPVPEVDDTVETTDSLEQVTDTLPVMNPDTVIEDTTDPPAESDDPVSIISPDLPVNMETNMETAEAYAYLQKIADTARMYNTVSVYYLDTQNGWYYAVDADRVYESASTIKAIYCQYLLSAGVDMSQEIPLSQSNRTSTSGKLRQEHIGSVFTVADLISYTIRYSDNMAYRLLFETFGCEGYNDYVTSLGLPGLSLSTSYEFNRITCRDLALGMAEIYNYSEISGDTTIVELLKNTTFNAQIDAGTSYPVAHKYGYQGGDKGYHDAAIVYADPSPYILTIMTKEDHSAGDGNAVFRELAALTEPMHDLPIRE